MVGVLRPQHQARPICGAHLDEASSLAGLRARREEGARVMERHFRGSRSIGYWSHFLFGIERDKQNLAGVTTFRVLKDRYTGDANGLTFGLSYDKDSGLLEQCDLPSEGGDFKDNFPDGEF